LPFQRGLIELAGAQAGQRARAHAVTAAGSMRRCGTIRIGT
jgi:hypothetical protein